MANTKPPLPSPPRATHKFVPSLMPYLHACASAHGWAILVSICISEHPESIELIIPEVPLRIVVHLGGYQKPTNVLREPGDCTTLPWWHLCVHPIDVNGFLWEVCALQPSGAPTRQGSVLHHYFVVGMHMDRAKDGMANLASRIEDLTRLIFIWLGHL